MAVKRTVGCPHCGAHKETKAAPRMRLRCASCGKPFRAPDVTDDLPPAVTPAEPAASADAAAASTETPAAPTDAAPPGASSGGGVSVARARPRVGAPAVDVEDQGDNDEPDDGQSPAQRRARSSRLTQRAGRKGGKASAAKRASVPAAGAYARSTGRA